MASSLIQSFLLEHTSNPGLGNPDSSTFCKVYRKGGRRGGKGGKGKEVRKEGEEREEGQTVSSDQRMFLLKFLAFLGSLWSSAAGLMWQDAQLFTPDKS